MDIYALLIIGHLIGTVLGVGGATMIEVHLNRALRDGTMSEDERGMLGLDFVAVRVGLVLALFTGVGFIGLYYANDQMFRLENPIFWAKMAMVVVIAVNALLLQAHKISLYWGSALSFVSWWTAMFMGIFLTQGVRLPFLTQVTTDGFLQFCILMIIYGALVALGAVVLHKLRSLSSKKKHE